ncbi:bifunctional riboflavin kinase/FAD synthetase [Thermosediminibacter oceani]|uniref:Riboflavin biosynthesis protein n=1 Tax=Thermosediminibacter oceani (strain ATCC BAA-1034 / DSM 16646 / JW/IW-1228P) TaxID=555079 RepID=D9S3L2_THEOJ|nr:bifunctional riboflavin kinase/FAD synthetase [Thermosediminibacter oceani]ADL07989.1 riboflavin biosynthesis protein RibF [Thermosediminibacter oceani DSM 16646]
MKVYKDLDTLSVKTPAACGLGNFDGVHLGHQKLISELVTIADEKGLESFVVTFEPHPSKILFPEKSSPLITSLGQKQKVIEAHGVKNLVVIPFTRTFSEMSYEEFIDCVLIEKLKAKLVVVGYNFRFGSGGRGTVEELIIMGKKKGFDTLIIPPVTLEEKVVSSTLIRSMIERGDMVEARALLGRPFSIEGKVVTGEAIGRKLGFPTANVSFSPEIVVPAYGVYAVLVSLRGKFYKGIANVGEKPTFKRKVANNQPTLEVHIFDFNEQIYGEEVEVYFIERIRDERLFPDAKSLAQQVKQDFLRARSILDKVREPKQSIPYMSRL